LSRRRASGSAGFREALPVRRASLFSLAAFTQHAAARLFSQAAEEKIFLSLDDPRRARVDGRFVACNFFWRT